MSEGRKPDYIKKAGWSISDKLITNNPLKTVSLQRDFPEPADYTIQFGVTRPPSPPGPLIPFVLKGEVFWNVAGNWIRRFFDVSDGTSITAPSQAVNVVLHDATPVAFGSGTPYDVSITCTPGTRFGGPVTLNALNATAVAPGGGVAIPIPLNAGIIGLQVLIHRFPGVVPSYPYEAMVSMSDSINTREYNPTIQTGFVPIIAGMVSCTVTNQDLVNDIRVSAIWEIDG